MKWLIGGLVVLAGVAAVGAIAAVIGTRLPRLHRATGERVLPTAPEALWQTLTAVEAFPIWRTDVKAVRRLPDRDGRPAWTEEGRSGRMTFAFERMEAPHLLVSRITDRTLPFGGTWTFAIAPAAEGSRLTITEDGEIHNPLFRFMARFVFGYDGTINAYLAALERRFNQDPAAPAGAARTRG